MKSMASENTIIKGTTQDKINATKNSLKDMLADLNEVQGFKPTVDYSETFKLKEQTIVENISGLMEEKQ